MRHYKPKAPATIAALREYYPSGDLDALANRLKLTRGTIACYAQLLGIKRVARLKTGPKPGSKPKREDLRSPNIEERYVSVRPASNDAFGIVARALAARPDVQVAVSGWRCGA